MLRFHKKKQKGKEELVVSIRPAVTSDDEASTMGEKSATGVPSSLETKWAACSKFSIARK